MAGKKSGLGRGLDGMFPSYKSNKSDADKKTGSTSIVKEKNSNIKTESSFENNQSEEDMSVSLPDENGISGSGKDSSTITLSHHSDQSAPENKPVPEEEEPKEGIRIVKISEVEPNPDQPRRRFEEGALSELASSIRRHGVVQPLVVVKKDQYYMIVAGERRWRAAKLAGLKEIPVVVRDYSSSKIVEISLIENIQREDLDPIEEAQAYQKLIDEFELRQEDLAGRVSKSRSAIANSLRLLKLDPRVQEMLISQEISAGHARALLGIEDPEKQYEIAMKIKDGELSVRETERLIKSETKRKKGGPLKLNRDQENSQLNYIYEDMEKQMQTLLGTKVKVNRSSAEKGKIEIEYYSMDELERLFDLIKSTVL